MQPASPFHFNKQIKETFRHIPVSSFLGGELLGWILSVPLKIILLNQHDRVVSMTPTSFSLHDFIFILCFTLWLLLRSILWAFSLPCYFLSADVPGYLSLRWPFRNLLQVPQQTRGKCQPMRLARQRG